jgi:hypothetical protein
MAAADSGCSVSDTSTQAQTRPACVRHATKESAREVRPEHSGPASSVMAPIGRPPPSALSSVEMPVEDVGRMTRGAGVSAEGMRSARVASICWRRVAAVGMRQDFLLIFAHWEEREQGGICTGAICEKGGQRKG